MINANGERFVDEGADFRNYTYAKYGRVILMQPGQFAWQVFDKKIIPMLRDEYRIKQVTKVRADTLEDLVKRLDDVDAKRALETIKTYNKAVRTDVAFNPNVKDGRRTEGLAVNKSNWANTIDEPPFEAYAVTCGITFTFGGLKIDTSGRVIDTDGQVIAGLHAAGELVGGLFYFNYPGGTGLMAGSVFGRIAARQLASARRKHRPSARYASRNLFPRLGGALPQAVEFDSGSGGFRPQSVEPFKISGKSPPAPLRTARMARVVFQDRSIDFARTSS